MPAVPEDVGIMAVRSSVQGETRLIERIHRLARQVLSPSENVSISFGDDAAALVPSSGHTLLISTDALVEGIHFDLDYFRPEDLGWKALAVNLSDIAAMGGKPLGFTTSLAFPEEKPPSFVTRIYGGMLKLAELSGAALLGGDLCASPKTLFLDVTILGEVKSEQVRTRKNARPGDSLFVTGELGASAIGLELLRRAPRRARYYPHLAGRHLRPIPRNRMGCWLAANGFASALIDLSDGLSTDLHHLCQASRVGAVIEADRIPLPGISPKVGSWVERPLLDYGLNGGEDYELLFTVPHGSRHQIPGRLDGLGIHEIGRITDEPGACWLRERGCLRPLASGGFDHFQK
ncbi:MAG: thiamine-phosphate kinase [Acidobacteriota bacterium]|nr:thiamine-phosphate kinase [Acidobacteriota bacterium]